MDYEWYFGDLLESYRQRFLVGKQMGEDRRQNGLKIKALFAAKWLAKRACYMVWCYAYLVFVHKLPFTALRLPENYSFTQVNCVFSGLRHR
jgi:hypothetical protein